MTTANTPTTTVTVTFGLNHIRTDYDLIKLGLLLDHLNSFDGRRLHKKAITPIEGNRLAEYKQNLKALIAIVDGLDPNKLMGMRAFDSLEITLDSESVFDPEVADKIFNKFVDQIDLSSKNIIIERDYFELLYGLGLNLIPEIRSQLDDLIKNINAKRVINFGESIGVANGGALRRGYSDIFAHLDSLDAFTINPGLMGEIIEEYSNVKAWDHYRDGQIFETLKKFIDEHTEVDLNDSLNILIQSAIDTPDSYKAFLILNSKLFECGSENFDRVFHSIENKALIPEGEEGYFPDAEDWLGAASNLLCEQNSRSATRALSHSPLSV